MNRKSSKQTMRTQIQIERMKYPKKIFAEQKKAIEDKK